ncbi:MAG: hypothetical protein H7A32_02635 [Deltaproteobacteria bacterium]|nr:hypothetical protein [Deltaproteobacteria bacterium]
MSHTLNRMEENWLQLAPLIQKEWNRLSQADLDYIDTEYDRLVEIVRQRYGGRKEIIQEAAIRTRLNSLLASIENN